MSNGMLRKVFAALLALGAAGLAGPSHAALVHAWNGEGNANDSVGTLNGTVQSAVGFNAGQVGQAFSFGTTTATAVNISADTTLTGPLSSNFSVSLWVNSSAVPGALAPLFFAYNINSYVELGLTTSGGSTFVVRDSSSIALQVSGVPLIDDGKWHQLVGVRNGTSASLYMDGVLLSLGSNGALGTLSFDNPCYIRLGNTYTAGGPCAQATVVGNERQFSGLLDEVQFYDSALSSREVAALYAAQTGSTQQPAVPEPMSLLLLGTGLAGLAAARRRQ